MKTLKKYQLVVIFFLVVSLLVIIYGFLRDVNIYIKYASVFIFGVTICAELLLQASLKGVKKTIYLEKKMDLWNSISYRVKKAGETSFNEMPLGIIVFNDEFEIEWSNHYAQEIFKSPLNGRIFARLNQEFADEVINRKPDFEIVLYDRVYRCSHILRDHVIYMMDITKETSVLNRYKNRTLAIGVLNLDNMDVATSALDAQERALHMSKIIGIITEWAKENDICFKGYSDSRYLLIMNYEIVNHLIKEGFVVLNNIQEYGEKEGIRITGSIGIACRDVSPTILSDEANMELELALNRGGNQAIVKMGDDISYYGAKSASFETRTPVYIRIKTEDLIQSIHNADKVLIMSHKDMDADAFGSSLAALKICKALNKDAKIIFDQSLIDETVGIVYNTIKSSYVNILDELIPSHDALKQLTDNSLLLITDCQYQNLLMNEKVYKKAKNVAIIDHHRRNPQAINNFDFLYIQPSASSTVELLLEMFEYIDCEIEVSPIEATWMLMGIFVDTNNFVYRTTSRTFSVLAKLQSYGADMAKVQRFLRENFDEYVKRMSILNNLEVLEGGYGIAVCDDEIYERSFIAKIADNIITVNNIKVAFCIGRISKDVIGISARSLDEANVQVIMERLGGGGHYNNAAAQISGITIEEAKEKLIKNITSQEDKGGKFMKIILTKDVKGKGKVDEVIDIPAGHANFLIHSNQAIEATPDNLKQLEMKQTKTLQEAEKHLHDMQELKKKVDALTVTVKVKVGSSGKLFGSVSTKEIVESFKEQNKIELDKRKILYDKTIDALGTYKIPIQLHREVTATITLYVVDMGSK